MVSRFVNTILALTNELPSVAGTKSLRLPGRIGVLICAYLSWRLSSQDASLSAYIGDEDLILGASAVNTSS